MKKTILLRHMPARIAHLTAAFLLCCAAAYFADAPAAYAAEQTFGYTGSAQTFTPPLTGTYKLEAWGASGSGIATSNDGGAGAYTKGNLFIQSGSLIYVYVGENIAHGDTSKLRAPFNGGGEADNSGTAPNGYNHSPGGGATDFRLVGGTWSDAAGLRSRIMVAAGGGGGNDGNGGAAGVGGGINGGGNEHATSAVATQTSGYAFGYGEGSGAYKNPSGATTSRGADTGAGGGGYYGGFGGTSVNDSGNGGSSYISGYTGCIAVKSASDSTPKTTSASPGRADSIHYSGYVFTSMSIIAGSNPMPTHDGTSTMVGNRGSGYAKISYNVISFDANGHGTAPASRAVAPGTIAEEPDAIGCAGYVFAGWYLDAGCTSKYDWKQSVNADVRLYAKWVANPVSPEVHEQTFSYTGTAQEFAAPLDGTYRLQVWGAQGGGATEPNSGQADSPGAGGYSAGVAELSAGDVLYAYIGGHGVYGYDRNGGWNGGGNKLNCESYASGSGGGATDFRTVSAGAGANWHIGGEDPASLASDASLLSRLIVAGGGGGGDNGGSGAAGGSDDGRGGAGGGTAGESGYTDGVPSQMTPATSSTGYAFGRGQDNTITYDGGAGGSGYYGGYASTSTNGGGGGGSGYIGGVSSGMTIVGTSAVPSYDGLSSMVGNAGSGYARISYQVISFNVGGIGTAPDSIAVAPNTRATEPDAPMATGCIFEGWYTDASCTTAYDWSGAVTADKVLYAKWTPENTTEWLYQLPGETLLLASREASPSALGTTVRFDDPVPANVPLPNGYVRSSTSHYKPAGTEADMVEAGYDETVVQGLPGYTIRHYLIPVSYAITYDLNDAASSPASNPAENAASYTVFDYLVLAPATRNGYAFDGWYDTGANPVETVNTVSVPVPAGNQDTVDAGAISSLASSLSDRRTGDIALQARWSPNEYTVAFDANGVDNAACIPSPITKTYEVDSTIPAEPPRDLSNLFLEWNTAADGSGDSYAPGDVLSADYSTTSGATVTLYAQWEAVPNAPATELQTPQAAISLILSAIALLVACALGSLLRVLLRKRR